MRDIISHAQPARLAEPWDARTDSLPSDLNRVRVMRRQQLPDVEGAGLLARSQRQHSGGGYPVQGNRRGGQCS